MTIALLLIVSLAPVIILLLYIYMRDEYKKEPLGALMKAFLGGIAAAITVIILTLPFHFIDSQIIASPFWSAIFESFGEAAIPEELCKFLFLYLLIWKNPNFDEYNQFEAAHFVEIHQ